MNYDYYSPYISVAAVTQEGERIPFWTNASPVGSPPGQVVQQLNSAGVFSIPYVTSVEVNMNLSDLPTLTVTVTPPYEDALGMLDSQIVEWGRTTLQVQFGYTSREAAGNVLSPVFSGLMMQPDISVGEDVTITFKAQGALSLAADERNITFSGMRRLELFQAFLDGTGVGGSRKLTLDSSECEQDPVSGPLLREKVEQFTAGHRTDWDAIYLLANQCRCWPMVLDDTLKLIPRNKRLTGPATRIFALYTFPSGKVGPQAGVFPILNFSTPSSAIYYPGVLKGLTNGGISSSDRKAQHTFYDGTAVQPALVGAGGGTPKASPSTPGVTNASSTNTPKDGASHMFSDVNDPSSDPKLKAEYERIIGGLGSLGIQVEVTSLGMPDLLPGDVVALRGLGKRISEGGNFGIHTVIHTFGTDGYQTKFTAFSNTSKMSDSDPAPTDPGVAVDAKPPGDAVVARPIDGGILT